MSLTIVIPAHDAARTIARCLRSIEDQEVEGLQVVVVDDGSSDGTADRVAECSVEFELLCVRQPRRGVSVARNLGVAHATGDWIAFVDADDWLPERSLAAFLHFATEHGPDVAVGDFVMHRGGGVDEVVSNINTERVLLDENDRPVLQRMCIASIGFDDRKNVGLLGAPWAKLYKRSFLVESFAGGELFRPGVARSQDVLFNVEAFGKVRSVAYFRSPVYVYVLDTASSSHRGNAQFLANVTVLVGALSAYIKDNARPDLLPAVHRMCVTLFDEGVQRSSLQSDPAGIRSLARQPEFAAGIRRSRMRDYSWPGRVKLATLKLRLYRLYGALLTVRGRQSEVERAT